MVEKNAKRIVMTLGRHALHYFFTNVFTALISIAALMIYTRLLTAADYGIYFLTHTTAALFYSLLYGSISAAITRFSPALKHTENARFTNSAFALMFSITVTAIFLTSMTVYFFHSFYVKFIWLGLALFLAQGYFQTSLDVLRAKLRSFAYLIFSLCRAGLTLLIGLGFIYLGFKASAPLLGLVLSYALTTILIYLIPKTKITFNISQYSFADIKKILSYGIPLALNLSLIYIVSNTDRWLLAALCSKEAAGLYSAAFVIPFYGFTILMTVMNLAAFPLIVKAEAQKEHGIVRQLFLDQLTLFVLLVCPLVVLLLQLEHPLMNLLLGEAYRQTAFQLMPWFILASVIGGLKYYYADLVFMLKQKTQLQLLLTGITVALNAIFNYFFILKWQMLGAIYGTSSALLIGLILSLIIGRFYYPLPFETKVFLKSLIPTILLSGLIFCLPQTTNIIKFILELILLGIAYLAFSLFTNFSIFKRIFIAPS